MSNFQVLHTDQRTCYDERGVKIPCDKTGQDAASDKMQGIAFQRFISQETVVLDVLTGLTWTSDASITEFPLTWEEALRYVENMNIGEVYGYTDWRLPDRRDLFTLVSHEYFNPALPQDHTFKNIFPGYYWTSTTCSRLPDQAWYIHIGGGRIMKGMKHGSYMVWPVRSEKQGRVEPNSSGQHLCYDASGNVTLCRSTGQDGEFPFSKEDLTNPRFRVYDHLVMDTLTDLIWTQTANISEIPVNWKTALNIVKQMNNEQCNGYGDWRLPNIRELESLVSMGFHAPALDADHPFENVQEGYWASTTSVLNPQYAWALYMIDGAVGVGFKPNQAFYVWPVRNNT